ncbi:NAD(P)-binding protein [Rhizodiscina lignyota]|uniref:NAD(P)-binding protein n=1 Tax=Rhizodiscina lignyota TaxID=1504668 RepID=A0A9P4MEZ3_9PEZI|nr:NAD(P)-binding protein [Rhizodiscina lignyota]
MFTPNKDIPDLSGKVYLVTGGNSGIGKETVLQLAKHNPQNIFLAARDQKKGEDAIADLKKAVPNASITFLPLDLSSLKSVYDAAETVKSTSQRLDVLVNNAGIMATAAGLTKDGYEIQFGTNYMGHALLVRNLMPLLKKTAAMPGTDVRVVALTSDAHAQAPKGGIVFDGALKTTMESTMTFTRYGQSKLANILHIRELAKRDTEPRITYVTLHPGLVSTNLQSDFMKNHRYLGAVLGGARSILFKSVEQGALTSLWAATSPGVKSGKYYVPVGKENAGSNYSQDPKLAKRLYDWTEDEFSRLGY